MGGVDRSIAINKDVYGHLMKGDKRAATEAIFSALLARPKRVAPIVAGERGAGGRMRDAS